jgi:hypothetical protein
MLIEGMQTEENLSVATLAALTGNISLIFIPPKLKTHIGRLLIEAAVQNTVVANTFITHITH